MSWLFELPFQTTNPGCYARAVRGYQFTPPKTDIATSWRLQFTQTMQRKRKVSFQCFVNAESFPENFCNDRFRSAKPIRVNKSPREHATFDHELARLIRTNRAQHPRHFSDSKLILDEVVLSISYLCQLSTPSIGFNESRITTSHACTRTTHFTSRCCKYTIVWPLFGPQDR